LRSLSSQLGHRRALINLHWPKAEIQKKNQKSSFKKVWRDSYWHDAGRFSGVVQRRKQECQDHFDVIA
jgi:hypothetical protein